MQSIPADLVLFDGEIPLWSGRMSWKSNWWLLFLGTLTFWTILGLLFFLVAYLRVKSSEYFVSNLRIYIKYGLIARRTMEIRNEWITNYAVFQGFIGRILNYGDILIATPAQYLGSALIKGVSDPMFVKAMIDDATQRSKSKT
ncbi:MAG: PH domain-containing protein [Archaeoglobales archaeon]|nr:PH domain-containing protein [Archaeoglobales archaeon]